MKIHKTDDTIKNRLADSDFTDEELKEAARIILDSMVEYVDNLPYSKNPPPEMPLPALSSASKQKRISKNRKKFLIQITAAATIIFVSAGSFFAFNDDVAAAYYSSKGGDLNYIILRDEENGLTFIISGNTSLDELKKIAEHIKE